MSTTLSSTQEYLGDLQPTQPLLQYETRHRDNPGPGSYDIPSSIATKEVLSPRRTEPQYSHERANKDDYEKTYIDNLHQEHMPRRTTKNCDFLPEKSTDSCAPQKISTKHSEPIWSMGKERREAVDNRYLSPDQQKHMTTRNTSNVDYLPEISSMDKQCLSTLVTEPRFKLNHADRYEYENSYISPIHQEKMPKKTTKNVDFILKPGIGKMVESTRKTLPCYGFGTARRDANSAIPLPRIRSPRSSPRSSPKSSPRSSPRNNSPRK